MLSLVLEVGKTHRKELPDKLSRHKNEGGGEKSAPCLFYNNVNKMQYYKYIVQEYIVQEL
jgi:hypothetical protein